MSLLFALLAALSISAAVSSLIFILLKRIEALKLNEQKQKQQRRSLKELLLKFKESLASEESKKSRIIIACIVFLLFQLILWKIILALILGTAAYLSIGMYYEMLKKRKADEFNGQLLDGLGIMTNSVRAGQSMQQAIENMIKETKPPFSSEFGQAMEQVRLGIPLDKALKDITLRVASKDLAIAVTAINLARESGGNLGEILTRIADTMRERNKIQGKVKALTAQGKASGYIVGAAPFVMISLLSIIEPSIFGLVFSTFIGNLLLVVVIFGVAVGMFFINKIVNINI